MIGNEQSVEETTPRLVAEREFAFTKNDFNAIACALLADTGIELAEAKAPLVYSRLVKRLRTLGLKSFKDYCALLESDDALDERRMMWAALTTHITRFFREAHHFTQLQTQVLPDLLERARRGARVRFWSAGCSTGEEPYSIALTILAAMPDAARYDIKVLATDIDPTVIRTGKEGLYTEAVMGPIDAPVRAAWFTPERVGDAEPHWRAGADLRKLVTFRELNLIEPWPMKGPFDVVFCRNTVIYLGESAREQVWARIARLLAPRGYLYIGHSERLGAEEALFAPVGHTSFQMIKEPNSQELD